MDIDDIRVRRRIRKNLGDLASLMESMKAYGLMNPIVVNERHELVAGQRRLEAARKLGWRTVQVRIIEDIDDVRHLEMEIDENTQRKNFTTDELAEAYIRLDRLKNPGIFRRLFTAIRRFFRLLFHLSERRARY
ncbi:MAG TPA: ParB N-terminal domain-containing protein [Spirochaetia bacterium]|nr:ParB N-terminal domain-containing protein [Spirochaetia bacterium]